MKYPQKKSEFSPGKLKEVAVKVSETTELMRFLIEKFPEKSRTTIKSLLAHKQVTVDDMVITKFDFPLKRGQMVYLNKKKTDEKPRFRGMRIVHEDANIIVIEKGSGLLSIATDAEKSKTAYSMLSEYVKRFDPKNRGLHCTSARPRYLRINDVCQKQKGSGGITERLERFDY